MKTSILTYSRNCAPCQRWAYTQSHMPALSSTQPHLLPGRNPHAQISCHRYGRVGALLHPRRHGQNKDGFATPMLRRRAGELHFSVKAAAFAKILWPMFETHTLGIFGSPHCSWLPQLSSRNTFSGSEGKGQQGARTTSTASIEAGPGNRKG